jgi:hypothetical protein
MRVIGFVMPVVQGRMRDKSVVLQKALGCDEIKGDQMPQQVLV